MKKNKRVYVVSYRKSDESELIVSVFDNYEAASKMYAYFSENTLGLVQVDECPLYGEFNVGC